MKSAREPTRTKARLSAWRSLIISAKIAAHRSSLRRIIAGLKIYAANDENVINASVEFDEKTLQPTYRLLVGLAGASSGIEIARRFGIRDEVIETARQNLDISAQVAENYLHKLQLETQTAEDLRIALEEEREVVAYKYATLEIEAGKKRKERQKAI